MDISTRLHQDDMDWNLFLEQCHVANACSSLIIAESRGEIGADLGEKGPFQT
jgi:hypothetical protein